MANINKNTKIARKIARKYKDELSIDSCENLEGDIYNELIKRELLEGNKKDENNEWDVEDYKDYEEGRLIMKRIVKDYKSGALSDENDEKGTDGFWDLAGEIVGIVSNSITDSELEELQEAIYTALKQLYREME